MCHSIGKGKLVGPDLKGVEYRHKLSWLINWIQSSKALIKANDRAAVQLFDINKRVPMPNQPMNKHQIIYVINYIKSLDKIVPANTSDFISTGLAANFPPSSTLSNQKGQRLFQQHCIMCHTIGEGKLVGPDLKGVEGKNTLPWLLLWIHSSQSLIKSNNKAAIFLFVANNRMVMPNQPLNQQQIISILNYIKSLSYPVSANATNDSAKTGNTKNIAATSTPSASPSTTEVKSTPTSPSNYLNYIWIGLAVVFLFVIYVLAVGIKFLVNPRNSLSFKDNIQSTALNVLTMENFTEGYYPVYYKFSPIKMVVKKINDKKHSALCTWIDENGYSNEGVFEITELTKLMPEG